MTALRTASLWFSVLATLAVVTSCSQDAGESCQTNSNCGDGLICCKGSAAERGFCGKATDLECGGGADDMPEDSGTPSDAAMSLDDSGAGDASTDAAAPDATMSVEDAGGDGG